MATVNVSPRASLEGRNITIEIDGLDTVARALGDLQGRSPQAMKVVNQTAREARKLMIAAAKARYVVNAAGARHLNDLKQKKKASNTDLTATLFISKMRNDLGYFDVDPMEIHTGINVHHGSAKRDRHALAGMAGCAGRRGAVPYGAHTGPRGLDSGAVQVTG